MKDKFLKYLFISLGVVSLGLGIVGILIPILPTTPFLLLASFLFVRSSKKLNDWLLNHKVLGEYIYNYQTHRAITRRAKIYALALLWTTISVSAYFSDNIYLRVLLVLVAVGVTIHIARLKTI